MTGKEQALEQKVEEAIESEDLPILGIYIQCDGANISSETSQVQLVFSILKERSEAFASSLLRHHGPRSLMQQEGSRRISSPHF